MKNENLQLIRTEYKKLKEEKQVVAQILENIKRLEQILKIKNQQILAAPIYSELVSRCKQTDEDLIVDVLENSVSFEGDETNNIYVYMGTFKKMECSDNYLSMFCETYYDDSTADYRIYRNLELPSTHLKREINVALKDCGNFEKENIVVYSSDKNLMKNFYNLQAEFLLTAINESQEKAVERVLAKSQNKSN